MAKSLVRALLPLLALVPFASAQFVAVLTPGVRIQSFVEGFAAGTIFILMPGIYRHQTVVPTHRNQFLGLPGAVLTCARVLNPSREGQYWVAVGRREALPFLERGTCDIAFPDCHLRVFI